MEREGCINHHFYYPSGITKLHLNISIKKKMEGDTGQISVLCVPFEFLVDVNTEPLKRPSSSTTCAGINLTKVIFGAHYPRRSFRNLHVSPRLFNKYTVLFHFYLQGFRSLEGRMGPPGPHPPPPQDFVRDPANLSPDAN